MSEVIRFEEDRFLRNNAVLWFWSKKRGLDHKMLVVKINNKLIWAKIRRKNGQFLPDFFARF